MISRTLALTAACALSVLGAAAAASAQDIVATQELARRATEMAADTEMDVTVAEAFTPGPAEPPAPTVVAPAPRPAYRNPWTTPRPSMREAFSRMAASFRADFQEVTPPPRSLAAAEGPEPVFDRAHDIDFTVADAFDAQRLAAPAASSHGVQAAARAPEPGDGVARARALNLEAAERNKDAASALEAYEAAQRDYEAELARWREQLDR